MHEGVLLTFCSSHSTTRHCTNFFIVTGFSLANIFYYFTPVVAKVLSVPVHTIGGSKVQLKRVKIPNPKESSEQYESNKLLIHQIPQEVDKEYLQLFLEGTLRMDSQDEFVVEVRGRSAIITFLKAQFSNEGR